jgi:hypothetical protein
MMKRGVRQMCRATPYSFIPASLSTGKKDIEHVREGAVLLDDEKSLLWLGESNENKTEKKKKGIT